MKKVDTITLDEICRTYTGFCDYADLLNSMDTHGYVPTIRAWGRGVSKKEGEALAILRKALIDADREVFPAPLLDEIYPV